MAFYDERAEQPNIAKEAIELSIARGGDVVIVTQFTYQDERYLQDFAEQWCAKDDTSVDCTLYTGAGWAVELVGDGDPR